MSSSNKYTCSLDDIKAKTDSVKFLFQTKDSSS